MIDGISRNTVQSNRLAVPIGPRSKITYRRGKSRAPVSCYGDRTRLVHPTSQPQQVPGRINRHISYGVSITRHGGGADIAQIT